MADSKNASVEAGLVVRGPQKQVLILELIARYKGLEVQTEETDYDEVVAVTERKLTIYGFWPCVEFLEERYPYPHVLPDVPVRRAIIRSLCDEVMRDPKGILPRIYSNDTKFICSSTPMLIDFVSMAYTEQLAPWTRHRDALSKAINERPREVA